MSELSTAVLSHNAGNTGATAVNFLLLATYYAISARSPEQRRNPAVPTVVPSLHGRRRGMATWLTTSASHGGTHRRRESKKRKTGIIMYLAAHTIGDWGFGVQESELEHSFGTKCSGRVYTAR